MLLSREEFITAALATLHDPDVTPESLVKSLAGNLYDATDEKKGDLALAVGPIFVMHCQMLQELEYHTLMDTLKRLNAMNTHQGAAELTKKSLQALRAVL